ncbi:MAG: flagellar hook assembly protein FlgD [Alphaproteobacteria bacterium]
MEVTPTNTTETPAPAPGSNRATLTGDLESFLLLLVTQLKNQDPLSPLDSNEFAAQLAQFATVEQAIQTNKNLTDLIGISKAGQAAAAVSYLGKTIEAEGDTVPLIDGKAEYAYTLPSIATTVTLAIANDQGRVVFSTTGETATGKHNFVWDGVDNQGNEVAPGNYRLLVGAVDSEGDQIPAETRIVGRVDGADTSGDTINLLLGEVSVPLDNVLSVKEPKTEQSNP